MQNSPCPRTFLTTDPSEVPLGPLGIIIAGPDLSEPSNPGGAGRSWAIDLPISALLSLDGMGLR